MLDKQKRALLSRQHAAVDFLPAIGRLLGDPDLATDVARWAKQARI